MVNAGIFQRRQLRDPRPVGELHRLQGRTGRPLLTATVHYGGDGHVDRIAVDCRRLYDHAGRQICRRSADPQCQHLYRAVGN